LKKAEFTIPVITNYPKTPALQAGTMAHSQPFVAKSDHQEALGFPGELVEDWHDKAIDKMGSCWENIVRSRCLWMHA